MSIPRPNIEMSIPVPFCSSLVASGLSHPLSCTQTEIILKRQTYFELQMWCLCLSFLWLTMSCFFPTNPFCSSFSAPPQTNNVHPDGSVTSSRLRFQVFVELSVSVFLRAAVFFLKVEHCSRDCVFSSRVSTALNGGTGSEVVASLTKCWVFIGLTSDQTAFRLPETEFRACSLGVIRVMEIVRSRRRCLCIAPSLK